MLEHSDFLLHPHEVIPSVEFLTDRLQARNLFKADMPVEVITVMRQVFVLFSAVCGTCQEIYDTHLLKLRLDLFIKPGTYALPSVILIQID